MNPKDCAYLVHNYIIGKSWVYKKPKSYESLHPIKQFQILLSKDENVQMMLGLGLERDRHVIRRAFIKAVKPILLFKKWKNGCRVVVQDKYGQKYLFTDDPAKYAKLAIAHGIPDGIGSYRVQLRCSLPWLSPEQSCRFFERFSGRYRDDYQGKYEEVYMATPRGVPGPDTVYPPDIPLQ